MSAFRVKLYSPPDTENFSVVEEQYCGGANTAVFDRSVGIETPEHAIEGLVKFVHGKNP
jgi:hypothetical protein